MAGLDLSSVPDSDAGLAQLRAYVLDDSTNTDPEAIKNKEAAITSKLCEALVKRQDAAGLAQLLAQLRTFFTAIPKAKTAKIVRSIIDSIARVPGSTQLQVWARARSAHTSAWLNSCGRACVHACVCARACTHARASERAQ